MSIVYDSLTEIDVEHKMNHLLQAKGFFMQAGLPPMVLAQVLNSARPFFGSQSLPQIWGLADMNGDGKMDINEFSIACKLINLKLKGMELPKVSKFYSSPFLIVCCSVPATTNAWTSSSHQPTGGDADGQHGDGNARCGQALTTTFKDSCILNI